LLTNRKKNDILNGPVRTGKIQLVDATGFFHKMRKSLGSKRHEISETDIAEITRIYGDFKENEYCRIFDNKEFGYLKVTIERPLKLNFQITEERIEKFYAESAFASLYDEEQAEELELKKKKETIKKAELDALGKLCQGKELQEQIINSVKGSMDGTLYKNRDKFTKVLQQVLKDIKI
jgi:type I restriction enzyme M protein